MAEHPRDDGPHEGRTSAPTPQTGQPLCPVCWTPFTPTGRQRYCTDTCRKTAWTRRQKTTTRRAPKASVPQLITYSDATVYTCPTCQTRYHGQQWCQHCNQPCTRLGLGGLCPHCERPVTITDLLDTQEPPNR